MPAVRFLSPNDAGQRGKDLGPGVDLAFRRTVLPKPRGKDFLEQKWTCATITPCSGKFAPDTRQRWQSTGVCTRKAGRPPQERRWGGGVFTPKSVGVGGQHSRAAGRRTRGHRA